MKKTPICLVIICLLLILDGCGNNSSMDTDDSSNGNVDMESVSTDRIDTINNYISMTTEITELESGFSVVRYDDDYAFDLFLEQGGASSDQDVLRFLTETMFKGNAGLQMGGDTFGCSTISVANTDGGYLFGRNFDWQTCDALVIAAYPEEGYASIATVNLDFIKQGAGFGVDFLTEEMMSIAALYAPLDGMNEKGLCVSVNMIQDNTTIQQNTDKPDITTTTAIRLMLDKAANVREALELLEQYDLHASMNYMIHFAIADNSGNSVAVEYVNNEMIVTETPILTNFYLAEGEKQGVGTQQSHTRFDILTETLENNSSMTALEVRDALDSVGKDNFGEFESTEWSVVFDQSALTAVYYHRENYEVGYTFQLLNAR
ncbi:MAG: linear amide C-N hydrolase [Acetatifactor sp.]|nr:linear amide C-N hydrolase [Acetatifactor sp.]